MNIVEIDTVLSCGWTFTTPTEIRINWNKLINFDAVHKPIQTAISSIETMDTISKLALHASITAQLTTAGPIWSSDSDSLWCSVIISRSGGFIFSSREWPKIIQSDCQEVVLQYILYATAEDAFAKAIQYKGSKGDQTHCQLLTRAARALYLAQLLRTVPSEEKLPVISISGASAAIGLMLDLFLYKVKTKPPATMASEKYTELESVLRSIIEYALALTENKATPEKGRLWARTVLSFASQQRAINKAHQLLDKTEEEQYTCEKTAQCYNTGIILLKWAKATSLPLFAQLEKKLTFGYKMDLSTAEQSRGYVPPELSLIQRNDVSDLAPASSLLTSVINRNIETKFKEGGLSATMPAIFGAEFQTSIFIE